MNAKISLGGMLRRCWVALCCLLVSYNGLLAENPTPKPYKILAPKEVATIHSINYGPLFNNSSFNNRSINTNLPVRVTPGEFKVNLNGAASYAVPIQAPPGTRNLMPDISLIYNSQGTNGPLGRGWDLGGLSAITRAGNDFYRDGKVRQVLFDNYDHFTLDGNHLIPVSGANGHNNTVYRTENETFSKVVSKGVSGNGPDWFEVTTRDGIKMEYGKSYYAQRNVQGGSTGMIWFLNKVSDQYGNYIEFLYETTYTETRIKEIKYTGNSAAGMAPYNKIKFFWDLRQDDNRLYQWGSYVDQRHLLEKIEVTAEGNQLMKKYEFEYGFDNLYSYLTTITESGADGTELNATIFKYGDDPTAFQDITTNFYPWFNKDVFSGDFNGDGHTDLLAANYSTSNGFRYHTSFRVHRKNSGMGSFVGTTTVNLPPTKYEIVNDEEIPHYQSFLAKDFNGNGRDDILLIDKAYDGNYNRMKEVKIYYPNANLSAYTPVTYSTSAPFNIIFPGGNYFFPGDFNGDGRADYVTVLSNGTGYKVFFSSPGSGESNEEVTVQGAPNSNYPGSIFATAEHVAPLDFNGDGKQDLMVTSWGWTKIYTFYEQSNGNWHAQQIYGGGYPIQSGNGNPGNDIFVGDFNGDGKSDVLTRTGTSAWTYKVAYSDGKTFHQENFPTAYPMNPDDTTQQIIIADVNGDGKSDVVHLRDGTPDLVNVYFGKGQSLNSGDFWHQSHTFTSNSHIEKALVGDFNGDGKHNIAIEGAGNAFYNILYFDKDGTNHLLHKVANGFNMTTEVNYKRLTEGGSFYTKGAGSTYPLYDIQLPIFCVSSATTSDGLSGSDVTSYSYEGAKLHRQGKGFMGFDKVTAANNVSGFEKTTEFEVNTTYYVPQVKKNTVRLSSNNSLVSEENFTNTIHHFGNKRIWPRLGSSVSTDHISGVSATRSYSYDTNGNVTEEVENVDNGLEVTTTQYSYTANGTWLPAKLWRTQVTKNRSGSPALTEIDAKYYNSKGAVIQRIANYGLPKAVNTYLTVDPTYGVVTKMKVSASGVATRETNFSFDAKRRFITQLSADYGQSESFTYDPKWGTKLTMTSVDGQTRTNAYDEFGRLASSQDYLGNTQLMSLHWDIKSGNGSSMTSVDNSVYYSKTTSPGVAEERVWYDIFNRERLSQKRGYSNQWIKTVTSYDARGNVRTTTLPFSSGSAIVSTHTYDVYNRPTSVSDNFGNTQYSYAYTGGDLTVTTTNPAGQVTAKTMDPTEKVLSSVDNGGTLDYTYDSFGRKTKVKLNGLEVASMAFDIYGNQTQLVEKNSGTTTYGYNSFGELIQQTDANGAQTQITYDLLGRVQTKSQPEGTISYQYVGNGSQGEGNIKKITNYNGYTEEYSYNQLGQITLKKENIDGTNFNTSYGYDGQGRLASVIYPSGFGVQRTYTSNGYLHRVKSLTGNVTIYQALGVNDFEQPTAYYMGDGKTTNKTYNALGMPTRIQGGNVQDLQFNYNLQSGNLNWRYDAQKGRFETFQYDNLNRLTRWQVSGQASNTINYGSNGNIESKTGLGTYSYHSQKINALTKICDASGPISHTQQDVTYTSFHQPENISEGSLDFDLEYGGDGQRRKMEKTHTSSGLLGERIYVGDYEKDVQQGTTREIHYIQGGDGLAAIVVKQGGSYTYYYTYKDYLGSILTVTNASGSVVTEQNFDPWGRRRNASAWTYSNVGSTPDWLYRGFTGHEHLDEVALINMNGRMYDPLNGRMLSTDNFVQDPYFSQNYNRYSYAFNNPLKYTDPSGEIAWIPIIIGAAFGAYAGHQIAKAAGAEGFWAYAGYMTAGAIIGGLAGHVGAAVAGSGVAFSNTLGIMSASIVSSMGFTFLGDIGGVEIPFMISFGVASLSFSSQGTAFNYLGKKGNKWYEDLGYAFGGMANLSDIIAGFNGTNVELISEKKDAISHSAVVNEGEGVNVSVGPAVGYFDGSQPLFKKIKNLFKKVDGVQWRNHVDDGLGWKTPIHNVNKGILQKITDNIANGKNIFGGPLKYVACGHSCVSYTSRALWLVGIPNIGVHPYLLHGSILARQFGIYSSPYLVQIRSN